jgi:Zn-dependent protease
MQRGALRLFSFAGIQVYLHFTWFIVAALYVGQLAQRYHWPGWGAVEYIGVFIIVLLHEFGHAFACRQTGGEADHIILWPLGGIAYVNPPPRPGAYLWSIAAGPLVNVLLFPILTGVIYLARWGQWSSDLFQLVVSLWYINTGLLIFNLLPVYPLDGGQIVRGLLWFVVGPIRSLQIASVIGFVGAIFLALVAFQRGSIWLGIIAFFILSRALLGWQQARALVLAAESGRPVSPEISPPPEQRP